MFFQVGTFSQTVRIKFSLENIKKKSYEFHLQSQNLSMDRNNFALEIWSKSIRN